MAVVNVANIVLPGKFDAQKDNWENYREQLFFALEAAGSLESVQKRALFLSQCGKETFSLIVSLLSPRKPSEVSFEEIVQLLNKFFVPTPHPILETEKFYARKQKPGEQITTFLASLHEISSKCKFEDISRRILEQLILGVSEESLKKELLRIKLEELTYERVVQQALNFESIHSSKCMGNAVMSQDNSRSNARNENEPMDVNVISTKTCPHCAKRHGNSKCRFLNAICYKCNKKGHIKAACVTGRPTTQVDRNRKGGSSKALEYLLEEPIEEECIGINGVACSAVHCNTIRSKPYMVDVTVNGVQIEMEVDSGSAHSILPYGVYLRHKDKFSEQLKPCKSNLVTWTNDKLNVKGEIIVAVEFNEKKANLPLLVSYGRGPALLGRTWFEDLGISLQGINTISAKDIVTVINENFPQLFDNKMDKYSGPAVHIDIKPEVHPVFQRVRPVPFPLRTKVADELKRMIKDGIITPVKHSYWATPLRIVPKADGTLRLCGDYRSTVNRSCIADSYPLPTANEAFFQLSGGKCFTKIDLKHAYNQLKVDEGTAELLTLNTPLGLMRMNRLAYGVNAATAIFQRLMNSLLAGIDGVACLLDDIVISGLNREEHDQRVLNVLQRLSEVGLRLNIKKCVFAVNRVCFLGYEIDSEGIHPSKEKIQEIKEKPIPRNKTELKAFLGLYNFYERFVINKASIMQPLYKLLKDRIKWYWGKHQQEAFEKAKLQLTSDLTLVHYNLERELIMLCDSSDYGLGAMLVHKMQDGTERPVIMGSRTLQDHERRYAQIDKEALAIMFGLKKFRQYLLGRKFSICTDHKPLLGIFGREKPIPDLVSARMLRWALTLNTFDYTLCYRPGKEMGNVDSLSRWPTPCNSNDEENEEDVFLFEQVDITGINSKEIAKETGKDQILSKVKFFLLHGWPKVIDHQLLPFHRKRENLSLNKECILWANRVVIPKVMQKDILNILHEGHNGIVQMKMMARAYVWFPSLNNDIENMVAQCDICQLHRNNPPCTEHEWPKPSKPWSRVHIDFMGPFMGKTFLILIDAFSKWPIIEMMPSMSSKSVVTVLRKACADHGLPEFIISDNGLAFTGQEFKEFIIKNNIEHITGAPYHPATNGQVERMIQTIKLKLKKQSDMPWAERVAKMLFQMRTAPNTVTGKTPAEMLNGRKYRTALTLLHPDLDFSTELKTTREEDRRDVRKKHFEIGDNVLLRMYNMNVKWQRGVVTRNVAPAVYEVRAQDGTVHRRHVDQLHKTKPPAGSSNKQDDRDSDEVVIPPPEEWPDIIGC